MSIFLSSQMVEGLRTCREERRRVEDGGKALPPSHGERNATVSGHSLHLSTFSHPVSLCREIFLNNGPFSCFNQMQFCKQFLWFSKSIKTGICSALTRERGSTEHKHWKLLIGRDNIKIPQPKPVVWEILLSSIMPATIRDAGDVYCLLFTRRLGAQELRQQERGCCFAFNTLGIRRGMSLKENSPEEQVTSARSQGRGGVSPPLRGSVEIAFLPTVNDRVYWYIIKRLFLSISLVVNSQLSMY